MSGTILYWLIGLACVLQLNCEIYQDRPKIKTSDGDLILEPALDKNIYLRPKGPKSSIYIGDIDILKTNTVKDTAQYQAAINSDEYLNGPVGILQKFELLEKTVQSALTDFNISVSRRVNSLHRRLIGLQSLINDRSKDECDSNPCEHGGSCLNLANGYHCLCPPNWKGKNCDVDVNECRNFVGTDLGCQNGATCINKPGTYACLCESGWYGQHCTRKSKDCTGGDFEMCGYGTCVPVPSSEGFNCICHQGWTNNTTSVACLTDVNECESYKGPRCSYNPKVECINLPGSFQCGPCPSGYEGDGYICNDIDECTLTPNGGCSKMVTCHNTIGSRICGSCPPGYQGDGVTCTYTGTCNINHGGCHSSAQCLEEISPSGLTVQCICPDGMSGDGMGLSGCLMSAANSTEGCANNPCGDHGRCRSLRQDYTCVCYTGYGGAHCDKPTEGCTVNRCQNGGLCREDRNTGFRCECTAEYRGSLCQVRLTACGGTLDAEEGSIYFPLQNISTTYNHNAQCIWQIHTISDKVINVTFTKFNVTHSPECTSDFLQIHDGRQSSSQLIGRFCGSNIPKGGFITSSQNNLYLLFQSSSTVAKSEFALHWSSVNPVCGGKIDATSHGYISSPGSPGKYPPNRDCYWHLITTPGKRISLHFFALDIETHVNCSFDYLAIYDGELTTDPLLDKYCSTIPPPSVQSANFNLLIHFHSDAYGSGNGFQIVYDSIEGIPGCGGYYTTDEGEIASPTYNGNYRHNLLCEYKIKTTPETKIRIKFKVFRLVKSYDCKDDYLKIYDGPSAESLLIGSFCGTIHSASFTSSSNTLYIKFRSLYETNEGFRITYKAVCENTLYGDSGIIKSPLYPLNYPHNKVCTYLIQTGPGRVIQLTFQNFDIGYNWACQRDNLEIRDGPDINSTLLGRHCGNLLKIPPVQTSTHNYLYLKFQSYYTSGAGFYANYTTIETGCGGIYKNNSGIINYPASDATSDVTAQNCLWLIIAPESTHIMVTWKRLDIKNMSNCSSEYLELVEIDDYNTEDMVGRYCATHIPPAFTTVTSRLKIKLVFKHIIRYAGFSLSYTILNDKAPCGGNYIKTHGTLRSPALFGWSESFNCTWIITVPIGQQILLNIVHLNLTSLVQTQCKYGNFLEIRNGPSETSPLIGQYCGQLQSKRIISLANVLHLYLHGRPMNRAEDFMIEWDSTITGCGGTLTSATGSILSPNYPNDYHEDAECFYKIITSAGSRIGISFTDLELERTVGCYKDYIEMYDGRNTNAPLLGKYCGMSTVPANIETSSNFVVIKFRSDSNVGARGFKLNYSTICNNTLIGRYGVIESPGYPDIYPSRSECSWNLQVLKGNKIKIMFTHFDIPNLPWELKWKYYPTTNKCNYDYLKITEVSGTNVSRLFCGSDLPDPITTESNAVEIKFRSVSETTRTGFRLEWANYGCGGYIRKQSGTISYNESFYTGKLVECEWLIETSPGKNINIIFTNIYMSSSKTCSTDTLEIYNGYNIYSPLLSKVCQGENVSISSDSNIMLLRFVKLSTTKDVYFIAHFNSTKSKCGGAMSALSGFLYSKNYPQNYENNIDCIWYISVPKNHLIELTFLDIDLYSNSNSDDDLEANNEYCGDSVLIYDTDNFTPSSNYTYRICENSNKYQIVSKFNKAVVQFKTDSDGTAKGFKASFSVTCGALIKATQDGIITNSKFINHSNRSCVWTIIAPTSDQKISVTVTSMSLPKDVDIITNRNCPSAFLRILDGNDKNAPLIGEFCGRKVPPTIVSRGNAITIELGSYTDKIFGDFSVHYTSIHNSCGGILTAEEGIIASPSYPRPYPINVDCEWIISASSGNKIYITFEQFELEYSEGCNEDYLEIRENHGTGNLLGIYCGNSIPTNYTKAAYIYYVKFHSNSKTSSQGFVFHFGYLHENDIQSLDSGELTSPLFPNPYKGAGSFNWRITITPSKNFIVLKINQLEIASYGDVSYNKLIIYDGYSNAYPVLDQLHGVLIEKKTIKTSSSTVYLSLIMDASNTGSLFNISWTKSSGFNYVKCGSQKVKKMLPGEVAVLKPLNYATSYEEHLNCEWIYMTQMGRHLSITFTSMSLMQRLGCYKGSISIYSADTLGNWKPVKETICELITINGETYNSHYMKIIFKRQFITRSFFDQNAGFEAVIRSNCGGLVTDQSGEIGPTWFDANTTFHTSQQLNCNWTIKVRPGRTIRLEFVNFNISNPNNVCNTYVVLHNGDSEEGPLLGSGKYCGDTHEKKTEIITSNNAVYVRYSSIKTETPFIYNHFKIYYEEINDECGSNSKLMFDHNWELIQSPNYPSIPMSYSECIWVFTGPPGVILRIDFVDRFDIEDDGNECGTEVVEIKDGCSELSPLIGQYCGKKPASTIKSNSNSLYVKYSTQLLVPRNGFKANISIDICGGTIFADSGEITSPGYPRMQILEHDTICEWHIEGIPEYVFLISLLDIHLPQSQENCATKVDILSTMPVNKNITTLKTICNDSIKKYLSPIETSSNHFTIKLTYGKQKQWVHISDYRGFRITFNSSRTTCGGKITTPEGYLETPNYPQETTATSCFWMIEVPNRLRRIRLEIIDSNQEKHRIHLFNNYFNEIVKATDKNNSTGENEIYEAVGNKLEINLILNPLARTHRFKAKFTSDEEALCGGELSSMNEVLVAPNLQRAYSCEWHYNNQVTTNNQNDLTYNSIFVIVKTNSSVSNERCNLFDPSIIINSPVTNEGKEFNRRICGNMEVSFRIPSSILDISASKSENDFFNFSLNLKSKPCGGTVHVGESPINIIVTPNFYNDSLECAWIVLDPNKNRIEFKMEGSFESGCEDEYITIFADLSHNIPLGSYCKGNSMETSLLTHYTYTYIQYHSNVKRNTTNVKLMAKSISHQCGGLIMYPQNVFTSPNYPRSYNANEECSWEIQAELGYRVSLRFIDRFKVEDTAGCTKDAIIIYDWQDDAYKPLKTVCGNHAPIWPFESTHNRLKVVFRTDATGNLDGFKAQWTPVCGGNYITSDKEKILYSPGYPTGYKANMQCSYRIYAKYNRKIMIKFLDFDLEGSYPDCNADNLTITAVKMYQDFSEVVCGNQIPAARTYQIFRLQFKTDSSVQRKGFKLAYYEYNCGGRVNDTTVIASTVDDGTYNNNLNCTWIIEAPPTKIVVVKFLYIDLGSHFQCYDYVALYDGMNIDMNKRLALLCGYINSTVTLRSTGNVMVLQFRTDTEFDYKGFKAAVYFSYSEAVGCGGRIQLTNNTSHILKSPLINDVVYGNFLDCHWSVTSPIGTVIKITFNKFHIESCQNDNQTALEFSKCGCDFVEIKDGINPNSLEIGTFCGHRLPAQLTSSENMIGIRLSTDGELVSSGFEATLTVQQTLCGESTIHVGFIPRRLKSPNYDKGAIPRGLHCVYRLSNDGEPIRISVMHLQIHPAVTVDDNRCLKDRFIIWSSSYHSNNSVGKDLVMKFNKHDWFVRNYFERLSIDLPKRFELCGHKEAVDFYMYGNSFINIITSPDIENEKYKGVEIEVVNVGLCGRNYTEMQGRISTDSDNLPHDNGIVDCSILITAPENHTISMYFLAVIMDKWHTDTYLKIFDGDTTSARQLVKINNHYPDKYPVFSTGRYMLLYNHRYSSNNFKYDVNYVATDKGIGCGGKLSNIVGAVTSPLFPSTYKQNNICEWVLETPHNTRLMIRFDKFDLGLAFEHNYLQLVDRNEVIVRVFSDESPADYTSDDNYLKLVFHTTVSNSGKGWSAVFAGLEV